MAEISTARYNQRRSRHNKNNSGFIKKSVMGQIVICAVFLASIVFLEEEFLKEDSFSHKAVSYILSENTDFRAKYEETKGFFKDRIEMTGLLGESHDFDPVRNMNPPAIGTVYQKFGIIENPTSGEEDFSYGVKIKTAPDEKVRSVTKGEAVECGYSDKYGNYILIKHSEKIYSFYSQLGEILIKQGDKVNSGQIISTTKANDEDDGVNMLYFEIRDGDSTLDPEAFIDFSDGNLK